MGFNLNDYATVEERLALFWAAHPEGRVDTTILVDDGTRIVVRTEVYAHRDHTVPTSVGHAEEVRTKSGINALSALEVCETSSVGRALANWRYQAKKRPSQLEMQKPQRAMVRPEEPAPDAAVEQVYDDARRTQQEQNTLCAEIKALAKSTGRNAEAMRTLIADKCGPNLMLSDLNVEQLRAVKVALSC